MILIIDVCEQILHRREFVSPIENVVKRSGNDFKTVNYKDIAAYDVADAQKVIICGTALRDNAYLAEPLRFSWIFACRKPILGICAGMQILGIAFGGKVAKKKHIEFDKINLDGFLGAMGKRDVYCLHNNFVRFKKVCEFDLWKKSDVAHAMKHKEKPVYGVLFHPEVRNADLIENFLKL